jgi:hypothetical protein
MLLNNSPGLPNNFGASFVQPKMASEPVTNRRAAVLNVAGNDALQAEYRGWTRRSGYWTGSDIVACLEYASLLAFI